jgi:uncharacterized protein (TIGR00106 family)
MPIMEISVVPLGTKTASVSKYVASSIKALKKEKGIKYKLTSMGTIVEADSVERLLGIASKMHNKILDSRIKRAVTTIKIDDRKDKKLTMAKKIKSVRKRLTS